MVITIHHPHRTTYSSLKKTIVPTTFDLDILQAAAESTIRYQNNCPLSVLDGVPIGIKDELNIRGFRTNCGRKKDMPVNAEDCATVAALRSLGVVIIGF